MKKLTFEQNLRFEVKPMEFIPSPMLELYDLQKLGKGNHKVEVGHYKGGCCHNPVYAIIKNGMILRFEKEACKEEKAKKIPEVVKPILKAGIELYKANSEVSKFPMPVNILMKPRMIKIIVEGNCIIIASSSFPIFVWACCLDDKSPFGFRCFDVLTINTDPL